jgi:Sec-independent protein translocase protein TatA
MGLSRARSGRSFAGWYRAGTMPFDGAFSPLHWLIVATVALLVLGPDQLPRAGREAAKAFRLVRDARVTITDELANLFGAGSAEEPDEDRHEDVGFAAEPAPALPPLPALQGPDRDELDAPIPWRPVNR